MNKRKPEKVIIKSYTDRRLTLPDKEHFFEVPINPEAYTQNYRVDYDARREHGQQGTEPRFISSAPEELRLDFTLDGTHVIEEYLYKEPVKEQVAKLVSTVYEINGNIHRPRFLKIFWGEGFSFPCVLSSLNLNYTLFDEKGEPLRVKVSTGFLNYESKEERERQQRNASPDLTHYRLVKEGDRLDLLTHGIYNDSNYFLQVAKANGLTSLRKTPVGTELYFPPLDKTET